MLNALYIRGRHFGVNVISSTQKFNALSTIIRVNSRQLYFFKMRNYKEIQTMVEELSALLLKKNFIKDDKNINNARNTLHSRHKANVKECNHFPTLFLGTTKEHTSYLPAGTLAVTKERLFNTIRDRMQLRWNRDQAGRRDTCFLASTHRWNPTLRSGRPSPQWGFDAATRCKNRFLWRIAQACGWSHLLGWEHVGSWQTT